MKGRAPRAFQKKNSDLKNTIKKLRAEVQELRAEIQLLEQKLVEQKPPKEKAERVKKEIKDPMLQAIEEREAVRRKWAEWSKNRSKPKDTND